MADASNNITLFLGALMESVQSAEDAIQQLFSERRIDTAVGAQLDIIGKIVGQARGELDDDTYRRYCRARIATNRSNGTFEDIIKVAGLVLDDDAISIRVEQQQIATIVVRLVVDSQSYALARIVTDFLKQARAAGVKLVVEVTTLTRANSFSFAAYGGADGPGKGFGYTNDAGLGGGFASALD